MDKSDELLKLINQEKSKSINPKELVFKFLKYWYWFIIAGVIGGSCSIIYSKYAPPEYSVNSLILVKNNKGDGMNLDNLFNNLQLKSDVKIENHIGILTSFSLNKKVIENLKWHTSWFQKMPFGDYNLYGKEPYEVVSDSSKVNLTSIPIYIKNNGDGRYTVKVNSKTIQQGEEMIIDFEDVGVFGQKFSNRYFNFTLNEIYPENKDLINNSSYYFAFNDPDLLTLNYLKRLDVSSVNKNADLIRLKLEGQCPAKEITYLNELGQVYIQFGLTEKNLTSENTIQFIDEQLSEIVDTLKVTGDNFTNFRANNNVFDLEQKASLVLNKLVELDSKKSTAKMQYDYYTNLNNYLGNAEKMKKMISPSVIGITDAGLNNLLLKTNELYSKKEALSYSLEDKNPSIQLVDKELKYTQKSLSENLENLVNNTKKELNSIQEQIDKVNKELENYPKTEQELINIKRMFDLNNELYTFLLQNRAEAEITKASNVPDIKILDTASYSTLMQTGPKSLFNLVAGLILSLAIPFITIALKEYFDDTIKSKEELQKLTTVPIIGTITHSDFPTKIPVIDHPRSVFTESMRSLRTNMEYLHKKDETYVAGIHSIVPSEGKSFISANLAAIIAANSKKVVLIGADMRKPTLHKLLGISNKEGLSTFLIGHHEIDEIIKHTLVENFDIIPSGIIPPNPAELLSSQKFSDLINLLKTIYDVILIDNSPSSLVTDSNIVQKHTDLDLFVVRQGYSHKTLIHLINQFAENNNKINTGIILNDADFKKHYNAYSYQYRGYYGKSNKSGYGYFD